MVAAGDTGRDPGAGPDACSGPVQIDQLPENYRIVLQLRDIEEFDTETVADMLEISTGAAKVRLHRARAALKVLLEPLLRGEGPL